eukprot:jgi/Undpi1/12757/HiC_scaffold_6.g02425.m1
MTLLLCCLLSVLEVSEITQSIGESAAKMGEDIQQTVNTLAAFDLEEMNNEINKVIQNVEDDIVSEETKIKQEDAGLKQTEVKILPWETRIEQKTILSHGLMEKVLSLSLEESNFTTAPPAAGAKLEAAEEEGSQGKGEGGDVRYPSGALPGAGFQLERHINVAVKMLSLDPNLAKIHARLISRIPEKTFWHHYFSRVAAFRTEVGLEPLCEDLHQDASGTNTSEEYDKVTHEDVQSMNSPSEQPAESVGPDVDNAEEDDDFSDLGELDDLDGDSDGDSIDAALEAEIAAELGEA